MIYDFNNLSKLTHAELTARAKMVLQTNPPETINELSFQTNELDPNQLPTTQLQEVKRWIGPKHRFLYYFYAHTTDDQLKQAKDEFIKAKKAKVSGRAYAQINSRHGLSRCFYVGGGVSGLETRFKQHLGFGARDTYALQMSFWSRHIDIKLQFVAACYGPDVPVEAITSLEDRLWGAFRPMFGRQGRR